MTCPSIHQALKCTTCRLAGLLRCPEQGTPLPLVESERVAVSARPRLLFAPGFTPEQLEQAQRILRKYGQ